jgi:hypothetical protein
MSPFSADALETAVSEVEAHVGATGWDQRPALFALVRAADLIRTDPQAAATFGLSDAADDALLPIEQEPLPEGDLAELLGRIAWPASVAGCALAQEIVVLPPSAEPDLDAADDPARAAAEHPQRREARLVVAVLRDGTTASALRLRPDSDDGADDADDAGDLIVDPDLAPNLVPALRATLED